MTMLVTHDYIAGQPVTRWWGREYGQYPNPAATAAVTNEYGLPALVFKVPHGSPTTAEGGNVRRKQFHKMRAAIDSGTFVVFGKDQTRYYGFRLRMPAPHAANKSFINFFGFSTFNSSGNSYNQLGIPNSQVGTPGLWLISGDSMNTSPRIPHPGEWTDVILRMTFKTDSTGVTEAWYKSPNATEWTKSSYRYTGQTFGTAVFPNSPENRIGIYAFSDPAPGTAYIFAVNKLRMGTTYEEVAAAFAPAVPAPTPTPTPAPTPSPEVVALQAQVTDLTSRLQAAEARVQKLSAAVAQAQVLLASAS